MMLLTSGNCLRLSIVILLTPQDGFSSPRVVSDLIGRLYAKAL